MVNILYKYLLKSQIVSSDTFPVKNSEKTESFRLPLKLSLMSVATGTSRQMNRKKEINIQT